MLTQKQLRDRSFYWKRKATTKTTKAALWKGEAKRINNKLMEERKEGMQHYEKRVMQAVALEGENSLLCDIMKIGAGQLSSLTSKLKAQHRIKEGHQQEKISKMEKEKEFLNKEKELLKKDKKEVIVFKRKLGKERLQRSKMASTRAFAQPKVSIFPLSVFVQFSCLLFCVAVPHA